MRIYKPRRFRLALSELFLEPFLGLLPKLTIKGDTVVVKTMENPS